MKGARGEVRRLTPSHLVVSPELIGLPLASPARRFLALAVDYLLLLLPTLIVALSTAVLSVWISDPAALDATWTLIRNDRPGSASNRKALRVLVPLLVSLEAPGLPAEVIAEAEKGDLDKAAELLDKQRLLFSLAIEEAGTEKLARGTVRVPIEKMIPRYARAIALYGIAALYFTLLTRSRRQATLGKRLLGIRVVALSGGRLGLLESFERFAAYLEIPATLGFCLISLWHDPNRRLPHDRLANTVVIRDVKQVGPAPDAKVRAEAPAPDTTEESPHDTRLE